LKGHSGNVNNFHIENEVMYSGGSDAIKKWNFASGENLATFPILASINGIAIKGNFLFYVGQGGFIARLSLDTKEVYYVRGLSFSA
jgi:hypothetical protein